MALTIPNSITTATNIEAAPLAENFAAIAAHSNTELVNRGGTVAMTAELQLADGNNAASKVYADNAVKVAMPTGATLPYAGQVVPAGFLYCDGTAVSRSTYAALFAVIGVLYGVGNSSTTFNLPNLTGRFPVGYHGGLTAFNAVGKVGGNKDAVVVSHAHGLALNATGLAGDHFHTITAGRGIYDMQEIARAGGFPTTGAAGFLFGNTEGVGRLQIDSVKWQNGTANILATGSHAHSNSGSVTATGGAATDANLPPYLVMNFIIKT